MRRLLAFGLATAALSAAPPALAQAPMGPPASNIDSPPQSSGATAAPESLVDRRVVDITGATVGSVVDVVLDGQGNVSLLIVDVGGFLGIGTRAVGIEPSMITVEQGSDLITSLTRDQIEALPSTR